MAKEKNQPQAMLPGRLTERPGMDGLLFFLLLLLYLFQMNPHPGFHDSLSYLGDSLEGFQPATNATSHFLYNNTLRTLVLGFQFLSPMMVVALVSVIFSILTLLRLYELIRLLGMSQTVGLTCVAAMGLSFTWWQQTETVEVYTFNAFFFLSVVRYVAEDMVTGKRKNVVIASVFLALGILTHIQQILTLPFFIYYVLSGREGSALRKFLSLGIAFSGLGILIGLALATGTNSVSAVFFDSQFSGNVTGAITLESIGKGMAMAAGFFAYNFHFFIGFMVLGLVELWRVQRPLFWAFVLLLVPYLSFGVRFNVADNHVFFIAPWLVLVIAAAFSLQKFFQKSQSLVSMSLVAVCVFTPLLYFAAWQWGKTAPQLESYRAEKAYKGGAEHLLWPGKRNAPDPLKLALEICPQEPCPEVEWNIAGAVKVLKLTNRWGKAENKNQ